MVPEAIDHVGVVVYGYLYEFGDLGILKTPVGIWNLLNFIDNANNNSNPFPNI